MITEYDKTSQYTGATVDDGDDCTVSEIIK